MERHSHSLPVTFRLPQALVLLLGSCLASSHHEAVTQPLAPVSAPSGSKRIKTALYHLGLRVIPFADRGYSSTWFWLFVGMVKLTAFCGLGTALWIWSNPKDRKSLPSSKDGRQDGGGTGEGKSAFAYRICTFSPDHVGCASPRLRDVPSGSAQVRVAYRALPKAT
jgi:hypothetical protein